MAGPLAKSRCTAARHSVNNYLSNCYISCSLWRSDYHVVYAPFNLWFLPLALIGSRSPLYDQRRLLLPHLKLMSLLSAVFLWCHCSINKQPFLRWSNEEREERRIIPFTRSSDDPPFGLLYNVVIRVYFLGHSSRLPWSFGEDWNHRDREGQTSAINQSRWKMFV